MAIVMSNNAASTLASGISSGATSFTVASGSTFPALSSGDFTFVTIGTEVIKVTARSGANFTCDQTTASHSSGDTVELRVTSELLNAFSTDAESLAKAGGEMSGNITMAGSQTVDGRDLSTDGSKLDGIAASANNYVHPNHSGDVTSSADGAQTIAADAVTYAKMQNVSATDRILGRDSSGAGIVEEITPANLRTMLNVEDGATADQTAAQIKTALENGIDSVHYVNASIDNEHLADNAVGTSEIADDAVTADKLANSINTAITANTAKTGITSSQATAITAALPKAGGTMTGDLILGDNVRLEIGSLADGDLALYHDGSNSYIDDRGTGDLRIKGANDLIIQSSTGENMIKCVKDAQVNIYYDNVKKFNTTANGVTVTGGAVGTMTTDNDGSFAMSASNNFKCTPAGNFALTFTAIVAQSGNILFINSGGHTISAHANTKVDANLLATISTAGTYLLAYFSDGTNVYMTNSAAYA